MPFPKGINIKGKIRINCGACKGGAVVIQAKAKDDDKIK